MDKINLYFQTNIYEFIYNYILSSPWLFYGLFIGTVIFLLIFIPEVVAAYKKSKKKLNQDNSAYRSGEHSDYKVTLIFYILSVTIVVIAVSCYWSLTLDTDSEEISSMQARILEVNYSNAEYNDYALNAYDLYLKDRKIKSWEAEAFKMGLDQLRFDDVRYKIKNKIQDKPVKIEEN